MNIDSLYFDKCPQTWEAALAMSEKCLPLDEGMRYEYWYNAKMERQLLAVLILAAHRSKQDNFGYVYDLAKQIDKDPKGVAEKIRHPETLEANRALDETLSCVGTFFCEPIKKLLLSMKNITVKIS